MLCNKNFNYSTSTLDRTDVNSGNYAIICSFSRSFDTSHIEQNRIHLISSIFLLDSNYFKKLIDLMGSYSSAGKRLYLFFLMPDSLDSACVEPKFSER